MVYMYTKKYLTVFFSFLVFSYKTKARKCSNAYASMKIHFSLECFLLND